MLFVLVPVYNGENTISRALDSAINQNFKDYKIIVINDGSKDSTEDILKEYQNKHPNLIEYYNKPNGGVCSARNAAIEKALEESEKYENDRIVWLDADDEFYDNNNLQEIQNSIDKIKDDENTKIIYFDSIDQDGNYFGELTKDNIKIGFEEFIKKNYIKGNDPGRTFELSIFQDKNIRFDESINGGEGITVNRIFKRFNAFLDKKITRIYHTDNISLTRGKLTQNKILNEYKISNKVLNEFGEDLKKYNPKRLGELYLINARLATLKNKRTEGCKYFLKGLRYKPFDIKRIFLYLISIIDIKLFLSNSLIKIENYFNQ